MQFLRYKALKSVMGPGRAGSGREYSDFPLKGTNPSLKKPSNIPEIYAKMFGRFH